MLTTINTWTSAPTGTSRRRSRAILLVGVLAGSLALAGCGSDAGSGSAAADQPAAAASQEELTQEDQVLAFYQCLRDNGLDVPDPEQPGAITLPGVDQNDPEHMAILDDCAADHLSTGPGGGGVMRNPGGDVDPEAMIEFTECMRGHDVDMPDPGPEGGLNMSGIDFDSPEFQAGIEECGELLGGSGPVIR